MALRLRIVSNHAASLGAASSTVFGVHGGTIGRATDNDWVLPDPERYLSSHHARIEYRGGRYWLADTSSNGTYVNDAQEPLGYSTPYELHDGDRLQMGAFEMLVTIDASNDFPPDSSAIVAHDGLGSSSSIRHVTENDIDIEFDVKALLASEDSGARVTPVNAWGMAVESAAVSPARKIDPSKSPAQAPATPPVENNTEDPARWHLSTRRVDPYRNPLRATDSAASTSDSGSIPVNGLQALWRGAGLDPASLPQAVQTETLQLAGQLLREMVLGLMDAMQTRQEVKNRFRVTDPTVHAAESLEYNPLQFSAGVDEALRKLFEAQGKSGGRYLGPVEAVRESFHQMKTHHQAVMAAMQGALTELLGRLDPEELRERFDRGLKRGGLLGATNKTKYWELYSEFYQSLSQKHDMPHLFMEAFAQAYAEKIKEAGSARTRSGKKN